MDWRTVPPTILLGNPGTEEVWRVVWHKADDKAWTKLNAAGCCDFDNRMIHLDERLKLDPTDLADTWLHELMHAALNYWTRGRPRAFDAALEEKVIRILCPVLSRALTQTNE